MQEPRLSAGFLFLYNAPMSKCLYCGENQISHSTNWFYTSVDILLEPIRRRLFFGRFGKLILLPATDALSSLLFETLKLLGLIRYNRDINKIEYKRARTLWDEAIKRGIDFAEVKPFGLSIDMYQAPINGKSSVFFGLPRPKDVDESILDWIDDKWALKQKLMDVKLPVPRGSSFRTLSQALKFFDSVSKPVIVKPRKGSRGRHTTTFVHTKKDLEEAFKVAKQLCHWVMVEEHLPGDVFRGTVINNQLIGVLGGSSPKVIGDGKHKIAELVEINNQSLPEGMKPIKVTEGTVDYLLRQNLNLNSILKAGQSATLSEKIGVAYGGISYDCTEQTHPEIKQMILKAAEAVGDPILGFDFIAEDITKPISKQRIGIIECNGAPFINLHYNPLRGETINAAGHVWDLVS